MRKLFTAIVAAIVLMCMAVHGHVKTNAAGRPVNQYGVEQEPDYYRTTDYFVFRVNWQGAESRDGRLVHARGTTTRVLRLRTDKGAKTAHWVFNEDGANVYEPVAFQSFVQVDLADGSRKGYFTVDCKLDERGDGIPAPTVRICGEMKITWEESKQAWRVWSADGYAVGWSEGGRVDALTEPASWGMPSKKLLPVRATCTVAVYGYLTDRQLRNIAPKRAAVK